MPAARRKRARTAQAAAKRLAKAPNQKGVSAVRTIEGSDGRGLVMCVKGAT